MPAHVQYNSGKSEWYTPSIYIDSVRKVLGTIDLDPASCEVANEVVKATNIYTERNSGLIYNWEGKVYLNPPYATKYITIFTKKLIHHYQERHVPEAICLVNNGTETKWFRDLMEVSSLLCFVNKRINFWNAGYKHSRPLQGQTFFYLGNDLDAFADEFAQYGAILKKYG